MNKKITILTIMLTAFSVVCASPGSSAGPIKALLITGGCCHDYNAQREVIPSSIDIYSKQKIEWTILHQRTKGGGLQLEFYKNSEWAKGYDVVVHNECFANIGDVSYIDHILQPHLDGVPAVLIHCTMHCYRTGPTKEKWFEFCGVHSPGHGSHHPFDVEIVAPEHEIMKGLSNWTTPQGELYFIQKAYPTMTPLAESKSSKDGTMHTNIWVNAYGPQATRVFATTIGHHNETMLEANYMEMLTRGFLWAAGHSVSRNIQTLSK